MQEERALLVELWWRKSLVERERSREVDDEDDEEEKRRESMSFFNFMCSFFYGPFFLVFGGEREEVVVTWDIFVMTSVLVFRSFRICGALGCSLSFPFLLEGSLYTSLDFVYVMADIICNTCHGEPICPLLPPQE